MVQTISEKKHYLMCIWTIHIALNGLPIYVNDEEVISDRMIFCHFDNICKITLEQAADATNCLSDIYNYKKRLNNTNIYIIYTSEGRGGGGKFTLKKWTALL